ncbi:MAG: hypothetical protein A3F42_00115 [Gammaproteobacteria bacterium RIFCSPHIGHO2_12_FULL_37_34]|nr:MAG: hypothetical protein A3F42_00115 [Gammaproteobacteria bacterium RIFCSPHIGHO2_12_FULL_37_34]
MKPTSLPKFFELSASLNKTTLKLHASQAHGLICGIICGGSDHQMAWENLITGGKTTGKTHELLQTLYETSAHLLDSYLVEFQLILPADSQALSERAEALTLWCQGFLTGLKLVNIPIIDRESSEMTEAINDIIEIAKMNYEEVVASEEDEAAYTELVEFIRVAVILIYQDLREEESSQQSSSSSAHLH